MKRKSKILKLDGRQAQRSNCTPTLNNIRFFPKHEILTRFHVDEILDLIPSENSNNYGLNATIETDSGAIQVAVASKKLLTFKKSIFCASCQAKGEYFLLLKSLQGSASLELFTQDGNLLTRDHIMPRSLGGSNDMLNSQTMCLACNSRKGSTIPEQ